MCCVIKLMLKFVWLYLIVKNCDAAAFVNTNNARVTRQINKHSCILPQHPQYGKWAIYQATSESHPGQKVPSNTVLQITCQNNYKLDDDATIVCIDGKWTANIGHCLRTCPARFNSPVMSVTCTHEDRKLANCEDAVDGTQAKFQCADFYEDQGLERHPVHYCYNGRWSHNLPECIPFCGKTSAEVSTLVVGGRNSTRGKFPWQIALYNATDKDLLCGGSLLNQRVVLTAAHCVTDEEGKLLPKEIYMVAAGKYHRKYDHSKDNYAQYSAIYEMYLPRQYKGDIQNYFGDIAIIVTKKTFELSITVQPVCVDWGHDHRNTLLNPKRKATTYVSGWGFTVEHKSPSDILKELEVPLVSNNDCNQHLDADYIPFLTDDKLCAGFLNTGNAVCKGDSGGGLVTYYKNRYYLIAVVSLSPKAPTQEGGCDSNQYGLYTSVHYYINSFILDKEAKFRPSTFENVDCEDDPNCRGAASTTQAPLPTTTPIPVVTEAPTTCTIPKQPIFGNYSVFGVGQISPGTKVSPGTILQISCESDYKANPNLAACEKAQWYPDIPQCLRSCPSLSSTPTTEVTCSFKDMDLNSCSEPLDGTIARHNCTPFYENVQLSKNPVLVCRNGSWDKTIPECVPICGLKSVSAQPMIVNGGTVKQGQYPWQVAIYRRSNKQFICGGALISQKLILTAAHCVTNRKGDVQPKGNFQVGVGKFYRGYYDPLDRKAQFSELEDIFVPLEYAGPQNNFLADIAVLVAKNTFVLSARVQPVCVDWGSNYVSANSTEGLKGYISGWGFTVPNSSPSDTLQDLEVPIKTTKECREGLPDDFKVFLTSTSFCGGYLNQNKSICSGDAGGGLVTKHDGRYYVTGIASTAPSLAGSCNTNQYTLYTRVDDFTSFISEKEAKSKTPSQGDNDQTTERPTSTTTSKPVIRTSCTLPQHPEFGKWEIYGTSSKLSPGSNVIGGTILQIICNKAYKLDGDSVILCENGKWSTTVGKCLKTCPAPVSSPLVKTTCIVKGKESKTCEEPIHGTRVKYECVPFYEDLQLSQNPVHTCQDGRWDHNPPQCVPVCGQKKVTAQPLIINGTPVKKGNYPWHVGIYKGPKKDFICSGALISQRIILTAALCVTNSNGEANSKDLYTIAAGKYYRKFDDSRDVSRDVQSSTLEDIVIHPLYKGFSQMSTGGIAILVTSKPLSISARVQPVCMDWGSKYEKELFNPNSNLTGFVTGWGFTAPNEHPADELNELEVPIIPNAQCQSELPEQFVNFLTYDKFCAGYHNKGKSVCKGDSGGALAVKFNGRFYISGIVDSSPPSPSGGCDQEQYALYGKVSSYVDFILQKVLQYKS